MVETNISEPFESAKGEALYTANAKVSGLGVRIGLASIVANEYTAPKHTLPYRRQGEDMANPANDTEKEAFVKSETARFMKAYQRTLETYNVYHERAVAAYENASLRAKAEGLTGDAAEKKVKGFKDSVDSLEAEIMLLGETSLTQKIGTAISRGKTAELAIHDHFQKNIDIFTEIGKTSPEIGKVVHDLIEQRKVMANHLAGKELKSLEHISKGRILASRTFPSLADVGSLIDEQGSPRVKAIVFEKGSFLSHAAMKAQTHGITLSQVDGTVFEHLHEDSEIIISGPDDKILITPFVKTKEHYETQAQLVANQQTTLEKLSKQHKSVKTLDGKTIHFHANYEDLPEEKLEAANAESFGLVRSECIFEGKDPADVTEDEWYEGFKAIMSQKVPKGKVYWDTTIRTIDTAGDKGKNQSDEDRKAYEAPILDRQFGALLRLNAELKKGPDGRNYQNLLDVMIPMIETAEHMDQVQQQINTKAKEREVDSINLGNMLERPSLLSELTWLKTKFISIGSNDLTHELLGINRYGSESNKRYDPTHPSLIEALQKTAVTGNTRNIPVSVCGDMASDPRYAILAVGAGIRNLSCKIPQIPLVKKLMERANTEQLEQLVEDLKGEPSRAERETKIDNCLKSMGISPKGFVDPSWQRQTDAAQPSRPESENS